MSRTNNEKSPYCKCYKTDRGYCVVIKNMFSLSKVMRKLPTDFAYNRVFQDDVCDRQHLKLSKIISDTLVEVGVVYIESWAGLKFDPSKWNVLEEIPVEDVV